MSLRDLPIKYRYKSSEDDLVKDFFIPALQVGTKYQRAVGFFSASSLVTLARGVEALLSNGGSMQVVCSHHLSSYLTKLYLH